MLSTDSPTVDYEDLIKERTASRTFFQAVAYFFSGTFIILITIVFMNFLLAMSIHDVQVKLCETRIRAIHSVRSVDMSVHDGIVYFGYGFF
jgi:hypothetical protein